MLLSVYLLLLLLMIIPSFSIGYLFNSLARKWWLAIPLFLLACGLLVGLARGRLNPLEWFALLAALVGGILSSMAMRHLKRGNYRPFVDRTPRRL